MEDNTKKVKYNNENDGSKLIVDDFKNELERLKQKLSKDLNKYTQMDKEKNKNNINFHYMNMKTINNKVEPNKNGIVYTEPKKNNFDININKTDQENEKEEKYDNSNITNLKKLSSLEELKIKYGISSSNKNNNEMNYNRDINLSKENFEDKDIENNHTINNLEDSDVDNIKDLNGNNMNDIFNSNKKVNDLLNFNLNKNGNSSSKKSNDNKYDLINLLNLKKDTEEEIKNIFSKKDILDLSSNNSDKENSNEEIINNNIINNQEIESINKVNENKIYQMSLIKKDEEEENNLNILKKNNNKIPGKLEKKEEIKELKDINLNQKIFKEKNNDYSISKAYDNNNLENDNKNPLITNENPINNNININNSAIETSMLNSKLDQQIKLINEKSEDNRIQEKKNQLKLKEIESSLQLDKRLTHDNREIRKNAIKELCEMCTNFNNDEEDKQKTFECFSPWVKYCLEETNSYVIPESLNFFILFNSLFPHFLSTSMKDFFDNIERYVNFGISSINENCFKIFFLIFQDKKLFSQSLNEIVKLLNTQYTKMAKFLNGLLVTMIDNNIMPENYIKILFEKLINVYIKIGTKLTEKKKIYSKLLIFIYNNIEDDYNTCIKNNIKLKSYKEIDALFSKIKKNKKDYKYRLYPDNNNNNNEASLNNYNNINFSEKKISKKTPEKRKNEIKNKDNLNNLILDNNNNPDVNDILSVLPNEFFEYHFLTQFQAKIKLLEEANNILNKIKNIKDKEKNLIDVYRTINYSIEDSNILIHLEGIKILENICRLVKNFINIQKLKLLLEKCFDKLKDKKSLVKNELFTLFNMIIENHCFEIDKFIMFILQFCCNQKKENAQVKNGLLEYIKLLFLQQNNVLCFEIKKIKEKDLFNFTKKIVGIIQKESLSSIKDLCSDLLIIFKKRVEDIDAFNSLISELPNYRKKVINEETSMEMEEGAYKKSLKRIKSSYSFSKTKYNGFRGNNNNKDIRHERNRSNFRVNNFERNNSSCKINSSFSASKNMKIKNNLNNKNNNISNYGSKSKNSTRTNFRNNNNPKSQTGGLAKFNPKKNNNNIKLNKNKGDNKPKNNLNSESNTLIDNNEKKNEDISNDNNNFNELKINNNKKEKKRENNYNRSNKKSNKEEEEEDFDKKKENIMDNIHNLDINSLDKYSKIIVKDFLIFVKKICDSEDDKKDDLSYHFNIIFMIFEKIIYRLIVLLNENQEQKDKSIKLKKLLDELIGYISKIIIITPCIHQIKGTKKFDTTLLNIFMEKIKEFCLNKEKFYMHLLLSLYKFCQKDEEFPKELEPKPAAIYFLKYLKDGYMETKSERLLSVLKEFISETKLLNLEEKKQLSFNDNLNLDNNLNELNNNDNDNIENKESNYQNIDIPEQYNDYKDNNININNGEEEEEKEKEEEINNKIKKDILNIDINEPDKQIDINKDKDKEMNNENINNDINKNNNIDNIALRLKQFQAKLDRIPKMESEKETTTITGSEEKLINNLNDNYPNKLDNISPLKINYSNNKNSSGEKEEREEEEEKEEEKEEEEGKDEKKDSNNKNKSKLSDNDFLKIEESIRLMSKRLDKTLNKMNESSHRSNNSRKANLLNSINNINNINNIKSINISKISERNNNDASIMTSESYLKNNFISLNNNLNSNSNQNLNINSSNNKEIIEQIISVVKGESNKNSIYQIAKILFKKLSSEEKMDFAQNLRDALENPIFFKQIPINTCSNLFDFILSILSYQILSQSNEEQIIVKLQSLAEYLLPFRQLNDMFKIMLFLLKKYFPKNLNNKIEDISLVMIKVISYLLKELLKKMNEENVVAKEIICEINDLFTVTPPSTLTTATPNARFYQGIFTLLKSITDKIASKNQNELSNVIQYLQENKIVCEDYILYLIRLQKAI